jgi:hypothetical protein
MSNEKINHCSFFPGIRNRTGLRRAGLLRILTAASFRGIIG